MTGGSITDNSTKQNSNCGGGVFNMGTFNLSGTVTITGNKMANGNANNVFSWNSNMTITVNGTLEKSSRVGVYEEAVDTIVVRGSTDTTVFTSDRNDRELIADGSNLKWVEVHKHPVCGDSQCSEHGGAIKWEPWTSASSLPTTSGSYYLKQSVTLSEKWELPANTSVNLCLNGCNITKNTPDCVIIVDKNGGNLTITDCKETVGRITHDKATGWGIKNEGTLTLWNGRIEGAGGDSYAGVFNDGTFTMNGGTITGFKASGVYNNDGTFTMNSGSITGNSTTTDGGGVYNAGSASFNMYGGSITGNAAEGNGGGVYNEGTFKLSGNVTITGNKKGTLEEGTDNNVCLPSDKTITVENGKTLTNDASVGITGVLGQTVVSGTTSTTGFTSENTDYELKEFNSGGCGLKLTERTVTISGVTLKTSEGGTEMTDGKTYDGVAVAYDAAGVSYTPNVSNVTLTYTWQKKGDSNGYTNIDGNAAPKDAGSYRLHVEAKRSSSLLGEQYLPFTISSKTLTITDLAVANKPYDGTNAAAISGTPKLSGVVEDETVTLVNGEPSFESVNAGLLHHRRCREELHPDPAERHHREHHHDRQRRAYQGRVDAHRRRQAQPQLQV